MNPALDPHDLAGLDDLLTQEEKAVRASVRRLCADRIDPFVADGFERGTIDDITTATSPPDSHGSPARRSSRAVF